MEITRISRFQDSGKPSAKALNTEFDYVAAALQQAQAESARAIRLNPTDGEAALLLPVKEERANKALVFDDQGNSDVCALPRQLSDISENSRFRHFTAEQQTKLDGIEPAATADQTGTEIVAAINGELGGNGWQSSGVADNAVSNAKLADVASGTLKGRVSPKTGDPEDLTAAQARALLNVADGATAAGAAGDAFAASHPAAGHAAATPGAAGFMAAADKAT